MSSRDEILARVRKNQPAAQPLPAVPTFDRDLASPVETFKGNLARMGGAFLDAPAGGNLDALIREKFPDAKVICSATPEVAGNRAIDQVRDPAELDDVDVGVVRAGFGVAETGSVFLTEAHFKVNALGFLSQHLVVLLDPKDIVPNLHHAYRHRGFFEAKYAVFMTGPSATADIEGVLIRGAQGIRSLTVIPRNQSTR
ncbi:MAG: LUD domain-containing protein [Burkholderiales bacterium]